MYVIVFKEINETKNRHQYLSQLAICTNELEIKHFHRNIFNEVYSIMSQKQYALIHFFQFEVQYNEKYWSIMEGDLCQNYIVLSYVTSCFLTCTSCFLTCTLCILTYTTVCIWVYLLSLNDECH
jgi:hypothetical protein